MFRPLMALQPPPDAEITQSPFGTTWIWCPVTGVIVCVVKGVLSAQGATKIDEILRRVTASGIKHDIFDDWEGMTDYDGQARVTLTNTALALRNMTEKMHLFVRSRSVAMGVKIASAVVPNLVSHLDRATFESALAESISRHSKR
jgi:hypothetical protein